MILQYFKKKENEYKKIADKSYINILSISKGLIKDNIFKKVDFESSFELISIILVFYLKVFKEKNQIKYNQINDELINNFISDLDNTLREIGIGDMSIGKYVKKYVKKFYFRIKSIDPILKKYDTKNLAKYLNSIKLIDERYTSIMASHLMEIYEEIKRNDEIVW